MPFPIDQKYIDESEAKLSVKLPTAYKEVMSHNNGGEFSTDDDDWELYKIRDNSDPKRISRSMNDIVSNTLSSRQWQGFPENAIAIASNGCGDQLVFLSHAGVCNPAIYYWSHETKEIFELFENFEEISTNS